MDGALFPPDGSWRRGLHLHGPFLTPGSLCLPSSLLFPSSSFLPLIYCILHRIPRVAVRPVGYTLGLS